MGDKILSIKPKFYTIERSKESVNLFVTHPTNGSQSIGYISNECNTDLVQRAIVNAYKIGFAHAFAAWKAPILLVYPDQGFQEK